ncbi:PBECR4 domain-containing protein [Fructilactobacillus fructivorans]|uniref:Phage-Barnase-EndoU-ColicinE5/D-RelE like nuclease 4 domain-containing protein n=1 Tax=Fructilactobacillus fructivorans TaxID=1614 RepID=A0A0C1PQW5_9LACO|nr:PBECR4 domain-containing protein [Fructilactobacillus fructivorans]KID42266.1 hypothetical protein LfDm3_0195 [Fructilactobacillus fructivorans]MCT0151113.1 hypothetical protein [Fructilactobacillus fructivorans]MCT2867329.1 hypothetical protein [Fructilactobacillus fructivorans]MCT2869152.1 hypothetical protein [Fructilactobacillus fructivorans]MCT2873128.1 hypothetical protein [Fructilactobacillus fructivorans]
MSLKSSNVPLGYLVISDENSINFKDMLDDYRHYFSGHTVELTTNYNLLSQVKIIFNEKDLPHLMGWEKVRIKNKDKNASKIIIDIDNLTFTKKLSKKNPNWKSIKKRNLNYNLLHRIFLDQDINVFVETSNMHPNRLHLNIVFVYNKKRESIILGFRKTRTRDVFVPVTLHATNIHNQYNCRRRTKVKSLKWLD